MTDTFKFTQESLDKINKIAAKYPKNCRDSAILPVLHLAHEQNGHHISEDVIAEVARVLDMNEIEVQEVVYFYTMFNVSSKCKYHIQVCSGISCWLMGSDSILKKLLSHYDVNLNSPSSDEIYKITKVECLGACANAPTIQINGKLFCQDLTEDSVIPRIEAIKERCIHEGRFVSQIPQKKG